MGTGRVEPEAMRALASRLAASPPALRRLVDAPLPVGLPAIAFAALPARPPREGAPGCRRHRKRPVFDGAGWDWGETCSGSDMPRLDPDGGRRDRRYLPHRSWPSPRRRRRREDDLSAHDTGEAERTGPARGRLPDGRREATGIIGKRRRAVGGRRADTPPAEQACHRPFARSRSSAVIRASIRPTRSRPALRSIPCQSGRLLSVNVALRIVS